MRIPSDDEIELAFARHCIRIGDPEPGTPYAPSGEVASPDKVWIVGNSPILRTSAECRRIVRACLALDVVVSDRIDSAAWHGVLDALIDLAERVENIEKREPAE